jgi:DNA-binding winged helix-turn-helix (wHTH) protein/tetratricopeptide (TPR) repeat protein
MGTAVFRFGAFVLDERRRELHQERRLVHLEPQVFDVLAHLVRHRDRVVTKAELLDEVWGSRFVSDSAITSRIKAARRAVGDTGRDQNVIRTVHGHGYRFVAPLRESPTGPSPRHDADPLVGRAFPMQRLEQRLADAASGNRATVLVTGEAGIGKTALAERFVAGLDPDRSFVVGAQCLERGAVVEPYLAVFDALTRLCRGPGGEVVVGVLAEAAPSWLVQMPSLMAADGLPDVRARSVGASSQRMLRELVDAFELLAVDRTVVVVLDDLHWSDPGTAAVVERLARRTDDARLLLVGTYRPDAMGAELTALARDLVVRGDAEELRLDRLDAGDVEALLEQWRPGLGQQIADRVYELTEGVPLFVRTLLSSWTEAGLDPHARDIATFLDGTPRGVQPLVERDLARLVDEDVEVLEAASVVGVDFAVGPLAAAMGRDAADVERRCLALAHRDLLRAHGDVFRFPHQLHQRVLYERVGPLRRTRYHASVGRWLEEEYAAQLDEHVGELALHFDRAGDATRAADYLRRAAAQAIVRGAHREALPHLDAALAHSARIPEGEGRARAELLIHLTRASALVVTHGWAAPELEAAYQAAARSCDRLDDPPERHLVTVGLATLEELRGRHTDSEARLAPLLDTIPAPLLVETHEVLACSAFHLGRFRDAVDHANRGLANYQTAAPNEEYARHGVDPGVLCHGWAAFSSWFLGEGRDAMDHIGRAQAMTRGQPYALATASVVTAFLHQYRDEPAAVATWADTAIALADEHGYPFRRAQGLVLRGWASAVSGDEGGLDELRAGLAMYSASGVYVEMPYGLGMLADALLRTGRPVEALEQVDAALAGVGQTRGAFCEPLLRRLKAAALCAARPEGPCDEAQSELRRALDLATALRSPTARLDALLALYELEPGEVLAADIRTTLARLPANDPASVLQRARTLDVTGAPAR